MPLTMYLYLIRHAQSANNALPEHLRVEDPGLTDLGEQQAEHLAQNATRLELTRIYVSPFLRTLLTVGPLARASRVKPRVRIDLHEQGGCYAGHPGTQMVGRPGMSDEEIRRAFPEYVLDDPISRAGWWQSRPYESYSAARERAERLVKWTQQQFGHTNERVAFITHADFKICFLDACQAPSSDVPYNTSITHLEISPQSVRLLRFNQVEHLPEDLLSH